MMKTTVKNILRMVADLTSMPTGAFNIRLNGGCEARQNSEHVTITPKENGLGIDIAVEPNTRGEVVYIPVVVDASGFVETVYNDFFIGENCDVEIVAGCGIHNDGHSLSQHDGIHTFHLGKNARVKYAEKHYGEGDGDGQRVLNPVTEVYLDEGAYMEMETVQIEGVDSTNRVTRGVVNKNATFVVKEKLMTSGKQRATTTFDVQLNGEGASTNVISRSVAKGDSFQEFLSKIDGNAPCAGHSECDAIIMDNACVKAVPEITANHVDASLIHEAAIGKIAGEQIVKLMTLGLNREEAEAEIVNGFLK